MEIAMFFKLLQEQEKIHALVLTNNLDQLQHEKWMRPLKSSYDTVTACDH